MYLLLNAHTQVRAIHCIILAAFFAKATVNKNFLRAPLVPFGNNDPYQLSLFPRPPPPQRTQGTIRHRDLWEPILSITETLGEEVKWPSHIRIPWNTRADHLADVGR